MASRLKTLLPLWISKEKLGYVEGRKIMDIIILSHEIVHSLKYTDTPGMIIKLNFSKDFDKLSWKYMEATMQAFGFCEDLTSTL